MKFTFNRFRIGVSPLMTLLLLMAHTAWAQTDAKLIEAAKKEGKVVWYTSTSVTESKPLLDDFEKLYPFVKGEIFRASGEKTLNRIMTESRAGRWDFDVVTISEVDALMDAKLLSPYKSPEAKNFISEFKDPDGYWTADYVNYMTVGYNPKLVSDKDAPKSWEDLLDSKW
jgi:iron(III) transport system substrate-binding protein